MPWGEGLNPREWDLEPLGIRKWIQGRGELGTGSRQGGDPQRIRDWIQGGLEGSIPSGSRTGSWGLMVDSGIRSQGSKNGTTEYPGPNSQVFVQRETCAPGCGAPATFHTGAGWEEREKGGKSGIKERIHGLIGGGGAGIMGENPGEIWNNRGNTWTNNGENT